MEKQMALYEKTDEHVRNNQGFADLLARWPVLNQLAFQPSPEKAPWHWQAILDGAECLPPYEFNFWPHVARANLNGSKSVEGWEKIEELVEETLLIWSEEHARDR